MQHPENVIHHNGLVSRITGFSVFYGPAEISFYLVPTNTDYAGTYRVELPCTATGGTRANTETTVSAFFDMTLQTTPVDPCANSQFIIDQTIAETLTLLLGASHTETLFKHDDTEN